jgi:Sulfotransferase family
MFCHQLKCIYVHIPKTAGQSIETAFLKVLGLTWETRAPLLLRPNDNPDLGPPRLAHLTASEYVSCGYITPAQFNSYFKFGFVRNPWDRIVSEYHYRYYGRGLRFKQFLFNNWPKLVWSDAYRHIIPQCEYLYDKHGNLLVDYIGRYENLQADFDEICRRLCINEQPLPHINKSSRDGLYTDYYDDESREYVFRLYQKDIETFKYEFGN